MSEKVLVNLLSEQKIPNLLSILHVKPDRVLALTTPAFKQQVNLLERLSGVPHEAVPFDAYALADDLNLVRQVLQKQAKDSEITVHFTGGTKIMALSAVLGAVAESEGCSYRLMYLDTVKACFEMIRVGPGKMMDLPARVEPVKATLPFERYLRLQNERVMSCATKLNPAMRERIPCAKRLLNDECRWFFSSQRELHDGKRLRPAGRISKGKGCFEWDHNGAVMQLVSGTVLKVPGGDAVAFFAGGWLEELCFNLLNASGRFPEVLMNVKLDLKGPVFSRKRELFKNEIDLVVTKGLRAALIECKAGNVTQDHIYKLAALRDHLLGTFGRATLVSAFSPSPTVVGKAKDYGVSLIYGKDINQLSGRIGKLLEA